MKSHFDAIAKTFHRSRDKMAMCCNTSSTCGLLKDREAASFCREIGMVRQPLDEALDIRIPVFSRIDFPFGGSQGVPRFDIFPPYEYSQNR